MILLETREKALDWTTHVTGLSKRGVQVPTHRSRGGGHVKEQSELDQDSRIDGLHFRSQTLIFLKSAD